MVVDTSALFVQWVGNESEYTVAQKNTRGRRAIRPSGLKYSLRQKINEGDFFFFFFINKKKIAPVKFSDRLLQNVTSKHNINFWTFKLWNHVYSVQKRGEIA